MLEAIVYFSVMFTILGLLLAYENKCGLKDLDEDMEQERLANERRKEKLECENCKNRGVSK